jgi:oligopeptide/dipeptide ABC transporter ATP-binding protein
LLTGIDYETGGDFIYKNKKYIPREREKRSFIRNIQLIFQNPYSSLNPRMKVGRQISHALYIQKILNDERQKVYRKSTRGEIGGIFLFIFAILSASFGYSGKIFFGIAQEVFFGMAFIFILFSIAFYYLNSIKVHKTFLDKDVIDIFETIGLTPPEDYYNKFPHELSGGEMQRVAISRALIVKPEVIVADEPTSMLDVSIRASILDLIRDLKTKFDLTVVFITHDLAVAKYFSNKIAIMYVGQIIEQGDVNSIFDDPKHPYTYALVNAIPVPNPDFEREEDLPTGEVPDALNPPSGCRYHPRCPKAQPKCEKEVPELFQIDEKRLVACFYPLE